MKASTRDKAKGTAQEVKGALKETVGHIINDADLETEGQAEKIVGKVRKKMGQVEEVLEK